MMKVTRRLGRLSGLIAAGVAIVGTGSVVMAASYSAFTATTSTAANSWSTGSVALTNDTAAAMFSGTNQPMTASGTRCITVTSNGSLATTVKLYSTGFSETNALGSHITLAINVGTGATNAACAGFSSSASLYTGTLAGFHTAYPSSYANGLATTWTPTGAAPESKVFQFVWGYDATAPQSSTATDTFNWEAQSG